MFNAIAKITLDNDWAVELGYDVPSVITQDTKINITTKIIYQDKDSDLDMESIGYKQAASAAEVLKVGFDIGCSYTTKVFEQVNKMGDKLFNHPENETDPGKVTGETTNLVLE